MVSGQTIRTATHDGILNLGGMQLPCAVLEDGTRVLSQRGFARAIGGAKPMAMARRGAGNLPSFLSAKNLKPFIDNDFAAAAMPILYTPKHGGRSAYGIQAVAIPQICDVWLKARAANALHPLQVHLAAKAEILMRGLAHVGIIALVDEATGYQNVRARRALDKILERFINKELVKWAKTFPDEFYEQLFRLRGWQYSEVESFRRPSVVGLWTNDIVYARLAPGVLDELRRKNPVNEKGRRKHKLFQWLTEDVGHPRLREHLAAVIALMKAAPNWGVFMRMVQRALPKHDETGWLFDVDSDLDADSPAGNA